METVLKGGRADLNAAARTVLQDWNLGKIKFYTIPPAVKDVHVSAEIVSEWGKAFDIDQVFQQEKSYLSSLPANPLPSMMAMVLLSFALFFFCFIFRFMLTVWDTGSWHSNVW